VAPRRTIERVGALAALCVAAASPARALQTGGDTLADIQRAAAEGEFARAMDIVRAESDPLTALRAEVWVEYRARDFEGACAAAERGLALLPGDLWLAERATASALWMRNPELATRCLTRFSKSLISAEPAQREAFEGAMSRASAATAELVASDGHARAAKSRARACALSVLGAVLVLLTFIGLGLRKPTT
jgi:predicted Zn-dependent protease